MIRAMFTSRFAQIVRRSAALLWRCFVVYPALGLCFGALAGGGFTLHGVTQNRLDTFQVTPASPGTPAHVVVHGCFNDKSRLGPPSLACASRMKVMSLSDARDWLANLYWCNYWAWVIIALGTKSLFVARRHAKDDSSPSQPSNAVGTHRVVL
jgi:hypothetical protein